MSALDVLEKLRLALQHNQEQANEFTLTDVLETAVSVYGYGSDPESQRRAEWIYRHALAEDVYWEFDLASGKIRKLG